MPPCYDIYGISNKRDIENIDRFINLFSVREQIEKQDGCEIFIHENKKYNILEEIIEISTLSQVIEYGILNKEKGFCYYLKPMSKYDLTSLMLKFTYDSKIIFGVSLEEKIESNIGILRDNYKKAKEIEKQIQNVTNSYKTSIQFESAPSDDEEEFEEELLRWRKIFKNKNS